MWNPIRRHAWGSTDAIPALLGFQPDGGPYAELWLSGFEDESSTIGDDRLADVVAAETGGRLPFLAKVLAIGSPLSLQLHPGGARAKPEMLFALTAARPCVASTPRHMPPRCSSGSTSRSSSPWRPP